MNPTRWAISAYQILPSGHRPVQAIRACCGVLGYGNSQGIEVIAGGERLGDQGQFARHSVLLHSDVGSRLYTDEIFGPVFIHEDRG